MFVAEEIGKEGIGKESIRISYCTPAKHKFYQVGKTDEKKLQVIYISVILHKYSYNSAFMCNLLFTSHTAHSAGQELYHCHLSMVRHFCITAN